MNLEYDGILGLKVHQWLVSLGIETPMRPQSPDPSKQHIAESFELILRRLKIDLDDDSLRETPRRLAKMYCDEIFYGMDYANFPNCTAIANKMKYDEMITQRCTVMSMCEHHFVPFTGIAMIGYIPGNKVIGLSKMNRIVDFFSRRPQVQERLTVQVAATLGMILETEDVAVVIQAEHMCVRLRGVKDTNSHTSTSKLQGRFMTNPALREEFLTLARTHNSNH